MLAVESTYLFGSFAWSVAKTLIIKCYRVANYYRNSTIVDNHISFGLYLRTTVNIHGHERRLEMFGYQESTFVKTVYLVGIRAFAFWENHY